MGKNKLKKFDEMNRLENVFQYPFCSVENRRFPIERQMEQRLFKNDNPIVIELGCGKGEYAVGLARRFGNRNYIGVDIKGARMWTGATKAAAEGIDNVAFLRTT